MAGQHEPKPLPYPYDQLQGISEQLTRWHHDDIYASFVEKRNEIERKLEAVDRSTANPRHSDYADLKRDESRVTNGMVLHQLYYDILGGDGALPEDSPLFARIRDDFGSFETWRDDFVACARATQGWAILAWDSFGDRLRNLVAEDDERGVWGMVPLVAIDMAEHAYYYDHGPKRRPYIAAFLANLSWPAVERRYRALVRE